MAVHDTVGDMLTRIRNGQMSFHSQITCPAFQLGADVLEVLKKEGYIRGFEKKEVKKGISELKIELKYYEGKGAIHNIQRVSKPGRRVYAGANDIPRVHNGLGISILSTPKGVMSDHDARQTNTGGEILCTVF